MKQAGGLHLDQDFASHRRGNVHVLEIEPTTECVKYVRLHLWPPCSCLEPTLVFRAAVRGTLGWRFCQLRGWPVFPESVWLLLSSCGTLPTRVCLKLSDRSKIPLLSDRSR